MPSQPAQHVFFDEEGNERVIASVSQGETTLSADDEVLRSAGAGATITEFAPEGGAASAVTHALTANFVFPGVGRSGSKPTRSSICSLHRERSLWPESRFSMAKRCVPRSPVKDADLESASRAGCGDRRAPGPPLRLINPREGRGFLASMSSGGVAGPLPGGETWEAKTLVQIRRLAVFSASRIGLP
jgi:hypothetical protein